MNPDDYVFDLDGACPRCGEQELRWRDCDQIGCEDGFIDEHDDDPVNFAPGEESYMCEECFGTGSQKWCSKCGLDITRQEHYKLRPQ